MTAAAPAPDKPLARTTITWQAGIPLATDPLVLIEEAKMIALVGGATLALMSGVFTLLGRHAAIPGMALLVAIVCIGMLGFFHILTLILGSWIVAEFTLDERGARCEVYARATRDAAGTRMGIFSMFWSDVARVRYLERRLAVTLRSRKRDKLILHCDEETFGRVAAFVQERLQAASGR